MQSFPNSIAEMLNWPIDDVYVATERLRGQLRARCRSIFSIRLRLRDAPPYLALGIRIFCPNRDRRDSRPRNRRTWMGCTCPRGALAR